MDPRDRFLARKLAVVLAVKLVVLVGLWWGFVREQRVSVDSRTAAIQLLGQPPGADHPPE